MSDPKDRDAPTPVSDALTAPIPGEPQSIERVIAAARTLELHGHPSIAQTAIGILRSKVGEREPDRREHPNEGPIVDWCLEGLTTRPAGAWSQWCSYAACQGVRRALIAAGADAVTIRDWRKTYASGSCTALWHRLEEHGLTIKHTPGAPVPEGAYFIFFGGEIEKDGAVALSLRHVEAVDRQMGPLVFTIGGNSGPKADMMSENKHSLADPDIYGWGRLPYDRVE